MEKWQAEIDKLKAQSKERNAEAEIEYNKKVHQLEQKKKAFQSKLQDVKNASSDAWESLKDGLQKASKDLGDAIESASKQFK